MVSPETVGEQGRKRERELERERFDTRFAQKVRVKVLLALKRSFKNSKTETIARIKTSWTYVLCPDKFK